MSETIENEKVVAIRRQWAEPPGIAALYNTPVQGGAADIIKRALGLLPQALQGTGAVMVGTIHDEILVEVLEDRATRGGPHPQKHHGASRSDVSGSSAGGGGRPDYVDWASS